MLLSIMFRNQVTVHTALVSYEAKKAGYMNCYRKNYVALAKCKLECTDCLLIYYF